jgi:hypothetical protein
MSFFFISLNLPCLRSRIDFAEGPPGPLAREWATRFVVQNAMPF